MRNVFPDPIVTLRDRHSGILKLTSGRYHNLDSTIKKHYWRTESRNDVRT